MGAEGSVELTDVTLTLSGGVSVLDRVTLHLVPGSSTALLGRSGSGKTTLLRMMNALVRPVSGRVCVDGMDIATLDEEALRALRRGIGYVIQEAGLFPHMTMERNVALPLEICGTPPAESVFRAHDMLSLVGLSPQEFAGRYPRQLSGGQRQRAGLARALITEPYILLLDEPFGALDPLTRAEMQTLLKDLLQRFRTTAVMVTHDLPEAIRLADTLVFMDRGRIACTAPSDRVWSVEDAFVKAYREASFGDRQ